MEDQKAPTWLTNGSNSHNNLSNSDRSHHPHHNLQQIMKHQKQQDLNDAEKPWRIDNSNNNNNNNNCREFSIQPPGILHLHHETIPSSSSPANPKNPTTNTSSSADLRPNGNNNNHNNTAQTDLVNHHSHGLILAPDPVPVSASPSPSLQCLLQPNTSPSPSSSSSSPSSRLKAEISVHPLYNQLLSAHVSCLRIATPVDQLPLIDAQIARSPQINSKYLQILGNGSSVHLNQKLIDGTDDKEELDQFMAHYVLLLCTFREQLQQHVKVHAMEAVMACWDIEQSLLTLTGVSPGEATGATMSDDDDDDDGDGDGDGDGDHEDEDIGNNSLLADQMNGHQHDTSGYGPLVPSETERTLMERVRQELKNELKNGYKERIVDVREEILRKRRAGKLPGDTTSVLKSWWQSHAKWPYPTEDEKARLVQETGLQLKQINNWFINQRKRNWHSNPSSSSVLKSKRKR